MYVKATFRAGHVGSGKHHEMIRYLEVTRIMDALSLARMMPRVKKNRLALISCTPISKDKYRKGKETEVFDPYLNTHKK